jgi:hypothetical protein
MSLITCRRVRNPAARELAWLRQVGGDRVIPSTGFKLGFFISQGINDETGVFYATRETLAQKLGVENVKTVSRLTELLEARGHLAIVRGRRGRASTYRLIMRDKNVPLEHQEHGDKNVPLAGNEGHSCHDSETFLSTERDENVSPIPLIILTSNTVPTSSAASAAPADVLLNKEPSLPQSPIDALWAEGVPIMEGAGVDGPKGRKMIGRWLKDARNDATRVLQALREAKTAQIMDIIPWVTASLQSSASRAIQPQSWRQNVRAERNADARDALMSLVGGRRAN